MSFTPKKATKRQAEEEEDKEIEGGEEEEKEEEEEERGTSKFAQRLQKLKARHTKNATASTPAKIATKLLELEEEEQEEEGEEENGEQDGGERDEGEMEEGEGEEDGDGSGGIEGEEGEEEGEGGKAKQTKGNQLRKANKIWAMYLDDEDKEEIEKKRAISREELEKMKKDIENRGVIYLSTIPPNMNPEKMKHYFSSNFGPVTRIHLAKKSVKELKKYEAERGFRSNQYYKEGWIEFKDKTVAKRVASCLTGTQLGGHGVEKKAVWNIRYLSKFKWTFLQEKLFNQKAEATKVMNKKLEEAKRDIELYRDKTEQAKTLPSNVRREFKKNSAPIAQKKATMKKPNVDRKRLPIYSQIVPAKKPKTVAQSTEFYA